jgi:hypothetical protein
MEAAGFAEPPPFVTHDRPAVVDVCRGLLEAEGFRVEVTAGPSYAVETLNPPTISPPLRCSTDRDAEDARPLRPDNWTPGEWDRTRLGQRSCPFLVGRGSHAGRSRSRRSGPPMPQVLDADRDKGERDE